MMVVDCVTVSEREQAAFTDGDVPSNAGQFTRNGLVQLFFIVDA